MLLSEIFISYSIEGQKPSNKRIASSAVPLWGSSARIGEGACQEARKHTVLRQRGAGHSAGKGCLSGMAEGEKRNSYNDRSCRGGTIFHGIFVPLWKGNLVQFLPATFGIMRRCLKCTFHTEFENEYNETRRDPSHTEMQQKG